MEMNLMIPSTLGELQSCLDCASDATQFISGGTDMILKFRENGFGETHLIDLSGVSELKYITLTVNEIKIGALTTLSTLINSDLLKKHAPMLCSAADQVGSTQIRNAATIGGNVANAFAGADLIPPLFALDACVDLLGKNGLKRSVGIQEFLIGNRKNVLETGEVIEQIRFMKQSGTQYFGKVGSRSRVTISKLNMAAFVSVEENTVTSARVAFGALGSTAFLSELTQTYLIGKKLDDLKFEALSEVMTKQVDDSIPTRSSRVYKRDAVHSLAEDLFRMIQKDFEVQYGS